MKEVGYLTFINTNDELIIHSNYFINFYNEDGELLQEEKELKKWAIWLNSPFSDDYFKYIISFDSEKKEKKWKCNYVVFGYDYVQSAVFGFGDTPEEAITNCRNNFKELQERYNPEHISM